MTQDTLTAPTLQNTYHSVRCYESSEISTLRTKVVACKEEVIKIKQGDSFVAIDALGLVFEKTILHPQGGGQPADQGRINGIPVVSVKEDKETLSKSNMPTVYHFLDKTALAQKNCCFSEQEEVLITLDTQSRQIHSQLHSAGHLIADIIENDLHFAYLSAQAIAGHHFPNEAYIKVSMNANISDREAFIAQLNQCIAEKITGDLPICYHQIDSIRHIKIGHLSRKCGGTHVATTKAIHSCAIKKIKISEYAKNNAAPFELTIFYTC